MEYSTLAKMYADILRKSACAEIIHVCHMAAYHYNDTMTQEEIGAFHEVGCGLDEILKMQTVPAKEE